MGYIIKNSDTESGEWIPIISNYQNCSNAILQVALYSKIGNIVNCSIYYTLDFGTSINQSLRFTLPFDTSISLATGSIGTYNAKGVIGLVTNTGYPNAASCFFTNTSLLGSTNGFFSASFMYKIQ